MRRRDFFRGVGAAAASLAVAPIPPELDPFQFVQKQLNTAQLHIIPGGHGPTISLPPRHMMGTLSMFFVLKGMAERDYKAMLERSGWSNAGERLETPGGNYVEIMRWEGSYPEPRWMREQK